MNEYKEWFEIKSETFLLIASILKNLGYTAHIH